MAVSLPGLSSGIDTTALISQLMAVAAAPETATKNQLAATQGKLNEYQALQSKFTALQSAADAISTNTFNATKATSSSSSVVATTSGTAFGGVTTTFDVTQLASAQISTLAVPAGGTVLTTPANGFDVVDGAGATHHLTPTDGTAAGIASAINGAGLGLKASVVTTTTGSVLQFTGTSSGAANGFTINGLDSAPTTLVAAQDAQVRVGGNAPGSYTVSSATNTFANSIPGLTFTVSALATGVTVSVGSDVSSMATKMQSFVDSANAVLKELSLTTAKGGTLAADGIINGLTQNVLSVVRHGTVGCTFASIGVGMTKDGQLTFDQAAFTSAYNTNPASVQTMASTLASGMSAVALNAGTTTLSGLVTSATNQIKTYNDNITRMDARLAQQQTSLQAKYNAMETMMNKLNSTSSWLTAQLAAITNSNSNNK